MLLLVSNPEPAKKLPAGTFLVEGYFILHVLICFMLSLCELWIIDLGGFDYDTSKVAEFEFYLLEELEFYLIVYHPYRDLTLIAKDLKLEESNLQTAW